MRRPGRNRRRGGCRRHGGRRGGRRRLGARRDRPAPLGGSSRGSSKASSSRASSVPSASMVISSIGGRLLWRARSSFAPALAPGRARVSLGASLSGVGGRRDRDAGRGGGRRRRDQLTFFFWFGLGARLFEGGLEFGESFDEQIGAHERLERTEAHDAHLERELRVGRAAHGGRALEHDREVARDEIGRADRRRVCARPRAQRRSKELARSGSATTRATIRSRRYPTNSPANWSRS